MAASVTPAGREQAGNRSGEWAAGRGSPCLLARSADTSGQGIGSRAGSRQWAASSVSEQRAETALLAACSMTPAAREQTVSRQGITEQGSEQAVSWQGIGSRAGSRQGIEAGNRSRERAVSAGSVRGHGSPAPCPLR